MSFSCMTDLLKALESAPVEKFASGKKCSKVGERQEKPCQNTNNNVQFFHLEKQRKNKKENRHTEG